MDITTYNSLCMQWHTTDTGKRLGQWLMDHLPAESDPQIYYMSDKTNVATLFFNRYVCTSKNGLPSFKDKTEFVSHQPY